MKLFLDETAIEQLKKHADQLPPELAEQLDAPYHKCIACGEVYDNSVNRDSCGCLDFRCREWPMCDFERRDLREDSPKHEAGTYYVNIYLHDRRYGGPEEGGWWYDVWLYDSCAKETNEWEVAKRVCSEQANALIERNRGRHPFDSMASTGIYEARIETDPGKDFSNYEPYQ